MIEIIVYLIICILNISVIAEYKVDLGSLVIFLAQQCFCNLKRNTTM